jgi:hypothetical protein
MHPFLASHHSYAVNARHRHTSRTGASPVRCAFTLSASSFSEEHHCRSASPGCATFFVRHPRGVKRAIAMPRSVSARVENCDCIQATSRPSNRGMSCGCARRRDHTSQTTRVDGRCACHSHDLAVMTTMVESLGIKLRYDLTCLGGL